MAAILRSSWSQAFWSREGRLHRSQYPTRGRFEQARGGTLFLDRSAICLPRHKTTAPRFTDGGFFRVGGVIPSRRTCASSRPRTKLETLVESGKFREDLFHRLNVIRIHVPKLSERREDIRNY